MKITKIYKNKNEYVVTLRDDDHTHYNYFGKTLKIAVINMVLDILKGSNFCYSSDLLLKEYTYDILETLSNVNYFIAISKVKQEFNRCIKHFSFVCK